MSDKQKVKILVVDDEPDIIDILTYNLKKEGYEVESAEDGIKAVKIAAKFLPDVILLDIMMPNVDGYEVCRFVKSTLKLSHIKIVFLSAKNKESDMEKGYAIGADLYVPKPFSTRTLVSKVNALALGIATS